MLTDEDMIEIMQFNLPDEHAVDYFALRCDKGTRRKGPFRLHRRRRTRLGVPASRVSDRG
jgi:hypothetical protein